MSSFVLAAIPAQVLIFLAVIVIFFGMVLLSIISNFFSLWIQSVLTGAGVGMWDLFGMWFRRVDSRMIVKSKIMTVQAGIDDPDLTSKALEAHFLARGNVPQVVRALIAAKKSRQIELSFRQAAAIDLAGRDVLEAVQTSVYPRSLIARLRMLLSRRSMPSLKTEFNCVSKLV